MSTSYVIAPDVIGLIVRGKKNADHSPGKLEQHADCILPCGQPVGFFGEGGDASSGSSGPSFSSFLKSWANGPSLSWNSSGLNMKGKVAYYDDLKKIRPMYVSAELAKRYDVCSTVLLLKVTRAQAELFAQYWIDLKLNPGAFNIIGKNCSTYASGAFIATKIVTDGIPGLDTPNGLFEQLKAKHVGEKRIISGFIGAQPTSGTNYDLVVEK
ncbi:MAG TPA: hypothetical protein VIZ65_01760 [Cellvibrionaceae bacterium]